MARVDHDATTPKPKAGRPKADKVAGSPAGPARPVDGARRAPAGPVDPPDGDLLEEVAETFAMLASPTRLHLLVLLSQGPTDVGSLAEAVDGTVAMVSQHLAKLRLADLVSAHREGKRHVYAVDDQNVVALIEQAIEHQARLRGDRRDRDR